MVFKNTQCNIVIRCLDAKSVYPTIYRFVHKYTSTILLLCHPLRGERRGGGVGVEGERRVEEGRASRKSRRKKKGGEGNWEEEVKEEEVKDQAEEE